MFPAHIEDILINVELHLNAVSAALVSGEVVALEASSSALRQASVDFSALVKRLSPKDLDDERVKFRFKKIASGIASQRESLIRRAVLVDIALKTVVPATQATTYAQVAGPYGSAGKQSGAFKYLSA
jgi:hypothetical protein